MSHPAVPARRFSREPARAGERARRPDIATARLPRSHSRHADLPAPARRRFAPPGARGAYFVTPRSFEAQTKFLIQTNSEILPARLAFPESQRGIAPSSTRSSRTSPTCRPDGTPRASSTSSRRSAETLGTRATTIRKSPTRMTPSGASRGNRGFSTRRRASARRSYCSGSGGGPS